MLGFAACALILSSCSQNEEFVDYTKTNQEEISFAPYVNKTKASVVNLDAMKDAQYLGFGVFAYLGDGNHTPFMKNLNVKWKKPADATTGSWSHSGKYYWSEDYPISFFALAPDNGDMISLIGNVPTSTLIIKDNVADQIDILAASAVGKKKGDNDVKEGRVDFTFKHALSRIGFKAKVKEDDNLKFKINSVSYKYGTDISNQGVLSFGNSDNAITIANSKEYHNTNNLYTMTLSVASPNELIIEKAITPIHGDDSYLMILPQDLASGKTFVTLTIGYQIAVAGDAFEEPKTATVTIPGMNYLMGKAYTHNLIFSGSGSGLLEVTFGEIDVEEWFSDINPETNTDNEIPKPAVPVQ